jgi:hypothetical protein
MTDARCPRCGVEVGATWRWCLACGYDPDGSAYRVRQAAIEERQRQGSWLPVAIVVVGLAIGGLVLWRTTPDDVPRTTASPTTTEISDWVTFTPPDGTFSVDLPVIPDASPPDSGPHAGGKLLSSWITAVNGMLFTVSNTDTAGTGTPGTPPGNNLVKYVEQLAGSLSGTVSFVQPVERATPEAVDYQIDNAIIGTVRGRAMLVGTQVRNVSVSGRNIADEAAEHVVQSFRVV